VSDVRVGAADEAARARSWVHDSQAAVCDVIEPWKHGTVVLTTRYPSYWDYNLVRVEDDAPIGADELVRFAEKALAGLAHRRVGFEVVSAGEPIRGELEALGWKVTRLVWMLHAGPAPAAGGLDVEQVHYDAVRHLRVAWHAEDFPGVEITAEHLNEASDLEMHRNPQVFAAFEQDRPVAFAQLERAGDTAEISSVYVDRDHRGRGIGTALTQAAIAAASELSDLWIVADDDGRAKQIYARLGFRPVWKLLDCLRLPPPGAASGRTGSSE
jgi:GNAT superfamily N-acetyltransferase